MHLSNKFTVQDAQRQRDRFVKTFKLASRMKTNMLAKKLTRARAKCPYCEGHWQAQLNGRKNHMSMYCDGDCGTQMME